MFHPKDARTVRLTIPDYQRYYDWRAEQRRDLFDDLEQLVALERHGRLSPRGGHFCGTIICTPRSSAGSKLEFDVVDGQQRLTTLALLDALLARELGRQPCVVDGDSVLFRPQKVDSGYFGAIVRGEGGAIEHKATLAQRNYSDAANEISGWLARLAEKHDDELETVLHLIETRLQFIFFVLPDTNEVSKVFETINNRGKPLTQMDLVKNHLIYMRALYDWDGDDVNSVWQAIQSDTLETDFRGGEDVDTVLRAVVNAMFRPGRRETGETDFKVIKREISTGDHARKFRDFLGFLKSAFTTFKRLRSANETSKSDAVTTQLTYLNHQPNVAGVLPLILVREWKRRDGERDADVLAAIEKANFRLYGLPNGAKRSDSHNVALFKLAHDYLTSANGEDMSVWSGGQNVRSASIVEMLTGIVRAQHKDGLRQIVEALTLDDDEGDDYYHWDGLRYFLARWEEGLRNNQSFEFGRLRREYQGSHSNDYLAREHIIPSETVPALIEYRDRQQLRRLGNFMLLPQGVNAALSNQSLASKIEIIEQKALQTAFLVQNTQLSKYARQSTTFREYLEGRNDPTFGAVRNRFNTSTRETNGPIAEAKALCDLREEAMVAFALRTWRMPSETLGDREGEAFAGLFSFRYDGETYESDGEAMSNKTNANYVFAISDRSPSDNEEAMARLRRRNAVLEHQETMVSW